MEQSSIEINQSTSVVITAANGESELDQPLYAINWFDYKSSFLYKLYSILVLSDVRAVGGKPIIKGEVLEKWEGEDNLDRKVLLVVKYPSADQFLKMVGKKTFQLKSLIRMKAVKRFVFGFTKKAAHSRAASKPGLNDHYLVHLFQGTKGQAGSAATVEQLTETGASIYFYGTKTASLGRKRSDRDVEQQPFLLDGVLILHARSLDALHKVRDHQAFSSFKEAHQVNNIYLLKRTV